MPVRMLIFLLLLLAGPVQAGERFGVAFWNVENLFDTLDDPAVDGDEEFTPQGTKNWTEERLQKKIKNLASVISAMFDGTGPAVLGLAEIENREVVQLLVNQLQPLGRNYQIVHQNSPSGRGIDCALIYDAGLLSIKQFRFHHVSPGPTREIVEVELSMAGQSFTVFVNHWPARYHPEAERVAAALILRTRIDEILAAEPAADVLVIGDLNDHPGDTAVRDTLNARETPNDSLDRALFNSTASLPADGPAGTYVFDNQWDVLDHVILSPGLLDEEGFRWSPDSTRVLLLLPSQLFHPRDPNIPRPNRSYSQDRFHSDGFSDHLPVGCVILQN